ncbi:branched-chain alpha-keto acid dehydrogenase E2 component [Salinihabitans flavidus]|uniref:Dihydrolipoamide acetyltransferase component of pyruvate dehydrogenase complex n=1 Tax=Salinihabitans flavidus TaxID=569882 RepID=A0A1H8SZA3_9RHOB|nr:dihydrolipoamide acetyltransferase family protein [Salinihabitans flavidus]SEO83688.1 branched-chain alpha-keto acid dehydrogenase E2 component [Salinihabitans flavidus]
MQTVSVKLSDVGEGVTEAELVEWHVKPGDMVREDDVLAAVMTDKATVEIPSLCDGKVVWTGGEIGERIAVGSELVRIETDQEVDPEAQEPPAPEESPTATREPETEPEEMEARPAPDTPTRPAAPRPAQVGAPRPEGVRPLAAPAVRARAREAGIDLRQVAGTGPAGRITHDDLDAVFAVPTGGRAPRARRSGAQEVKVIGLRRRIADRMALANQRIAHITVVEEVDVTALEELRAQMNDTRGDKPKLTILPFIVAALARAVEDHPEMNAHFDDEAGVITRHNALHAGIATQTDGGLMVPVLHHAEAMGIYETAAEIARLSQAARDGKATRDDLTGSTITVTSLGPLGAIATTPIINHPEVAILGVNKIATRPHWDGNGFVPRRMMNLSASFDHRVIDGWNAAVFVQRMRALLQTPALIFMED